MSSPVKDLPKIASDLKGELLKERSLKPTEAQEKNVLPSADDVKQEKTHQNIMTGITLNLISSMNNNIPIFQALLALTMRAWSPLRPWRRWCCPAARRSRPRGRYRASSTESRASMASPLKLSRPGSPPLQWKLSRSYWAEIIYQIVTIVWQTEKAREGALTAVSDFDKTKLKKAETDEKNPLPSSEAIAQELEHIKFKVCTGCSHKKRV